jgi:hypothetical protein
LSAAIASGRSEHGFSVIIDVACCVDLQRHGLALSQQRWPGARRAGGRGRAGHSYSGGYRDCHDRACNLASVCSPPRGAHRDQVQVPAYATVHFALQGFPPGPGPWPCSCPGRRRRAHSVAACRTEAPPPTPSPALVPVCSNREPVGNMNVINSFRVSGWAVPTFKLP